MGIRGADRFREREEEEEENSLLYHAVIVVSLSGTPSSAFSNGRGPVDAEIKLPSAVENLELPNALPLRTGVGQNIAMHNSPIVRSFPFVLISTFQVHSASIFLHIIFRPYFLTALVFMPD